MLSVATGKMSKASKKVRWAAPLPADRPLKMDNSEKKRKDQIVTKFNKVMSLLRCPKDFYNYCILSSESIEIVNYLILNSHLIKWNTQSGKSDTLSNDLLLQSMYRRIKI